MHFLSDSSLPNSSTDALNQTEQIEQTEQTEQRAGAPCGA
jgi:hypothetical protein